MYQDNLDWLRCSGCGFIQGRAILGPGSVLVPPRCRNSNCGQTNAYGDAMMISALSGLTLDKVRCRGCGRGLALAVLADGTVVELACRSCRGVFTVVAVLGHQIDSPAPAG